jgi:hypothetical protein
MLMFVDHHTTWQSSLVDNENGGLNLYPNSRKPYLQVTKAWREKLNIPWQCPVV